MDILSIISFVFGIIGVILTIYYGIMSLKLAKKQKTLTWEGLLTVIDSIYHKIRKDRFRPEIIIAPGLRGGIIAELIISKFDRNIPVFVGISYRNLDNPEVKLKLTNFENFNIGDDWDLLLPENIYHYKDAKVLIVDDFCLTGNFFKNFKDTLITKGFKKDNIKIFCTVVTNVTISANRSPDYYSIITDDDYYYFPWGKANLS